jgi:hypothetical protein
MFKKPPATKAASSKAKLPLVYAYAFDELGLTTSTETIEVSGHQVQFVPFQSELSLEPADGLIIPSGVFEKITVTRDVIGDSSKHINWAEDLLAIREKQVFNALKKGTWVVFLLRALDIGGGAWLKTDLAKKCLSLLVKHIETIDPYTHLDCKADEFRKYLDRFGIARTFFWLDDDSSATRVLALANERPVGIEINAKTFFVPFFTTVHSKTEARDVVSLLVDSITEYKRKHQIYLPEWVKQLRFAKEAQLLSEIEHLEEKIALNNNQVEALEKYRAILTSSGRMLNEIIVEILRDYFSLTLSSEERYIEDALILGDDGKPLFVVEVKGVNGGLKREHVNQVDSHRERLQLPPEIPGLLIINDYMDLEGLEARAQNVFDEQHITRAKNSNIKILRTTVLFQIMLAAENIQDRKSYLLSLLNSADPLVEARTP